MTTAPGAGRRGAVFVLGATTAGQQGPVASWVSTAGWASAAERVLGAAWIITPSGAVSPTDARARASAPTLGSPARPGWRRRVPAIAKTAGKDVRTWRRATAFARDLGGPPTPEDPWSTTPLAFVWQRHELFQTGGLDLARRLGVPSVLFAPATLIWEAGQWGVARPGWGAALERRGEAPALRAADLVACGSDLVAEQAVRLGTDPSRILIVPTGVDLTAFGARSQVDHRSDADALRRTLGLTDRFVVGWTGSFRSFHGVERAVDAVAGLPDTTLLLVGDGPERSRIEALAAERGVAVACTGTVPHADLPAHLAVMDVALVLAPPDGAFHYSPLKLAEYLAAGLAIVAPAVPQIEARLRTEVEAILVPVDDEGAALAGAVAALRVDPARRARLGDAARAAARASWSWDHQVERVVEALGAARSDDHPPGRSG